MTRHHSMGRPTCPNPNLHRGPTPSVSTHHQSEESTKHHQPGYVLSTKGRRP